jgi:hypothetical protein
MFIIFSRDSSFSTPVHSLPVSPVKGQCDGIWVRAACPPQRVHGTCTLSSRARDVSTQDCFWNPKGRVAHIPPPPPPAAAFSRTELVVIVTGHGWGAARVAG